MEFPGIMSLPVYFPDLRIRPHELLKWVNLLLVNVKDTRDPSKQNTESESNQHFIVAARLLDVL